jgi:Uncharacterized alpha/beta hydrolase domain (DUF2235)
MEPTIGPQPAPKTFVLCFDGTGNKFSGDESDSNVLKIFRVSIVHWNRGLVFGRSLSARTNKPF